MPGTIRCSLLCGLLIASTTSIAFADGKVFSVVEAVPTIPDQQALIHYANGKETLVIETRFIGEGKEFAWVVPLPAVPEISPVTTGLFPTLQRLFSPHVVITDTRWYAIALAALVAAMLLVARRYKVFLPLLLLSCCVFSVLMPSLARSRSLGPMAARTAADGDVLVHDRLIVGAYDIATISSAKPAALMEWLAKNGFVVEPVIEPTVARYVSDGWVFVAARIRREVTTKELQTPHPLSFDFPTQRPVYPMRLTGAGSRDHCAVDLYVFGPERAEIPNFDVKSCERPVYPAAEDKQSGHMARPQELTIVHPLLRKLVAEAPVATFLRASLTPADMATDAYITWKPIKTERYNLYTGRSAMEFTLNVIVPPVCLLLFITWLLAFKHWIAAKRAAGVTLLIILVASVATLGLYRRLPKTTIQDRGLRSVALRPWVHMHVASELIERLQQYPQRAKDLSWFEEQLREYLADRDLDPSATHDDSPGSGFVRQGKDAIEYVSYDAIGGEEIVPLTTENRSTSSAPASRGE